MVGLVGSLSDTCHSTPPWSPATRSPEGETARLTQEPCSDFGTVWSSSALKPGWRISDSGAATVPVEPRLEAPAVLPAAPPKTLPQGASPSGFTTVAFSHFASSNSAVCHFASGLALVTRQAALDSLRTTLPDSNRTTRAAMPPSLRARTERVLRPGFRNFVTSVWAASAHSSDLPAG